MRNSHGTLLGCGALAAIALAVAGCSGGGGGAAPGPGSPAATPSPSSTTFPQSATAILTFPYGKRSVKSRYFVSPNSTSVKVTINSVNGQPPPVWVPATPIVVRLIFSGTGQNCTVSGGIAQCAITIPAPPGNVAYTIESDAVVSPAATPVPLDYGQEVIAIKQGQSNTVAITLQGVVSTATVSLATPLVAGVPIAAPGQVMTVTAFDASGAQITGTAPYDGSFKLTDADPDGTNALASLSTFLEVNGVAPAAKSVIVSSPTDVVTMSFGGIAMGTFGMQVTGNGRAGPIFGTSFLTMTLQPIVLPGTLLDDTAHGGLPTDPNYNQNTLTVPLTGGPVTITPSEDGWTVGVYNHCALAGGTGPIATCLPIGDAPLIYPPCNNGQPTPVAIFSPGAPNWQQNGYTYTVTPKKVGLCLQQFVDGLFPGHSIAPVGNPLVNGEIWVKVK